MAQLDLAYDQQDASNDIDFEGDLDLDDEPPYNMVQE
jgi:hypothetical protein